MQELAKPVVISEKNYSELSRTVVIPTPDDMTHALRHFKVLFSNATGRILGESVFSFECAIHHTVDMVPYWIENGRLKIGAITEFSAPLLMRRHLNVVTDKEVSAVLFTPSKVRGTHTPTLGGAFLPSSGSSVEIGELSVLETGNKDEAMKVIGEDMVGIDAVDLVDGYTRGEPVSTRLLLSALRLMDKLNIEYRPNIKLSDASKKIGNDERLIPKRSAEYLRQNLKAEPADLDSAFRVNCVESLPPKKSFLNEYSLALKKGERDSSRTTIANLSAMVRKGVDAVDVGAYVWEGDEACLVFKRGLRPSLVANAVMKGEKIVDPLSALSYEGIAESLEGEQTIDEIGKRAAQGVREEAGVEPLGEPVYIGSSFPLPTLHSERVFNFFVEVDPTKAVDAEHTIDERVDVMAVSLADIIQVCDEGIIKDPRLEINARLINRVVQPCSEIS